ncbi:MAG: hypothetical protein O9305_20280, partial [Rhodobacteraceae bacterium]|nr:hypothetical protein [Paracoccaceae bacterium]
MRVERARRLGLAYRLPKRRCAIPAGITIIFDDTVECGRSRLRRASSYLSRHQAARGRLSARVTAAVTTSVRSGFRVTVAMCDQLRVAP